MSTAVDFERLPAVPRLRDVPRRRTRAGGRVTLRMVLVGADAAALLAAWSLAGPVQGAWTHGAAWALGGVVILAALHLYRSRVAATWANETAGLIRATTLLTLVAMVYRDTLGIPDGLATLRLLVTTTVLLLIGRGLYRLALHRIRQRGGLTMHVLVVGRPSEVAHLVHVLQDTPGAGFVVDGVLGPREGGDPGIGQWLGELDDVAKVVQETHPDGVIVETAGLPAETSSRLIHGLLEDGVRVQVSTGLRELDHRRMTPRPVGHEPLLYLEPPTLSALQRGLKRGLDLLGATIGLTLSLPLLLLAAATIWLEDRGPILFHQERVGRDARTFTIWKLRTMQVDAEARGAELEGHNHRDGPLFKMAGDPRVTRVGHLLRALSIDEIPQFWNVLRGDMSLVGPRPALPSEVAVFDAHLQGRHRVRPGITGLWQVEARNHASFGTYRRLDLFYVRNWSIELDLAILLATVGSVLASGATARRRPPRQLSPANGVTE